MVKTTWYQDFTVSVSHYISQSLNKSHCGRIPPNHHQVFKSNESNVAFHNLLQPTSSIQSFRRLVPQHLRKFRVTLPFLSSTCRLQSFLESFKRPNQICGFHVKHDRFLQLIWPILRFHEPFRSHLVPFFGGGTPRHSTKHVARCPGSQTSALQQKKDCWWRWC